MRKYTPEGIPVVQKKVIDQYTSDYMFKQIDGEEISFLDSLLETIDRNSLILSRAIEQRKRQKVFLRKRDETKANVCLGRFMGHLSVHEVIRRQSLQNSYDIPSVHINIENSLEHEITESSYEEWEEKIRRYLKKNPHIFTWINQSREQDDYHKGFYQGGLSTYELIRRQTESHQLELIKFNKFE